MNIKKNIRNIQPFLNSLRKALAEPLPGVEAQRRMAPPHRPVELRKPQPGDNVRDSAVLILLWPDGDQISTVFILRPEYDGVHSNQIAFPGGKYETTDIDFVATALRETQEEIGVHPESIAILGQLSPLYIPPSQFLVYPIVGFIETKPSFIQDPVEIQEVLPCHLFDFLDSDHFTIQSIAVRGNLLPDIPCYKIGDRLIWGATAMIFSELLEIIRPLVSNKVEE